MPYAGINEVGKVGQILTLLFLVLTTSVVRMDRGSRLGRRRL